MLRRVLLTSIGCLGASGLTLLACSLFGLGLGAFLQEPEASAAPRSVRATLASTGIARPRMTATPRVVRSTRQAVSPRRVHAQGIVWGSSHVEAPGDEDKTPTPLPPTNPAPPAPALQPLPVEQPSAPLPVAAPVLDTLPIAAVPPIEVPIPLPEVPPAVQELLP
jgi:hypothetical protein